MFENIEMKIKLMNNNLENISIERKNLLDKFAKYINDKSISGKDILLNFICTHNSRRSQMCQVWAQTASEYYGVKNIKCFSGGTEVTAFNPRAVKAIRDAGFIIEKKDNSENPIYLVKYSVCKEPLKCFSKVYSDSLNPQNDYAAIITCSHADENCPVVIGADERFPIRYDDPKEFDNTTLEEIKYAERFEQIGLEMLYVFSNIIKG